MVLGRYLIVGYLDPWGYVVPLRAAHCIPEFENRSQPKRNYIGVSRTSNT